MVRLLISVAPVLASRHGGIPLSLVGDLPVPIAIGKQAGRARVIPIAIGTPLHPLPFETVSQ